MMMRVIDIAVAEGTRDVNINGIILCKFAVSGFDDLQRCGMVSGIG